MTRLTRNQILFTLAAIFGLLVVAVAMQGSEPEKMLSRNVNLSGWTTVIKGTEYDMRDGCLYGDPLFPWGCPGGVQRIDPVQFEKQRRDLIYPAELGAVLAEIGYDHERLPPVYGTSQVGEDPDPLGWRYIGGGYWIHLRTGIITDDPGPLGFVVPESMLLPDGYPFTECLDESTRQGCYDCVDEAQADCLHHHHPQSCLHVENFMMAQCRSIPMSCIGFDCIPEECPHGCLFGGPTS